MSGRDVLQLGVLPDISASLCSATARAHGPPPRSLKREVWISGDGTPTRVEQTTTFLYHWAWRLKLVLACLGLGLELQPLFAVQSSHTSPNFLRSTNRTLISNLRQCRVSAYCECRTGGAGPELSSGSICCATSQAIDAGGGQFDGDLHIREAD